MQYDESSNGSEVEVSAGQEFDLVLPETPTAGYRWTLKNGGGLNCLMHDSSQSQTEKTGGTGTHVWHFRAPASGTCSIVAEYKRSWETSSQPERTFKLKVRVRSEQDSAAA